MKAPDHKLGNRIKSARKAKNLTQEKLAEQINISTSYIAEIENKKTAQVLKSCVPYVKF